MVHDHLQESGSFKRRETLRSLDNVPEAAAWQGQLFEAEAHEQLGRGGEFVARSLAGDSQPMLMLWLQKSHYAMLKLSTGKMMKAVFENTYVRPDTINFEALDSFYHST